ncbi:MAG: nitrogen regulation protein NR(II) [Syntrophobacteraceae bacterium]
MDISISDGKYQNIFNSIPNAVLIVDNYTLRIFDCNNTALNMYGYSRDEILGNSLMDLFSIEDRKYYSREVRTAGILSQVKQVTKNEDTLYVNIYISPSAYLNRDALLVVASDITERLMTEQQLIQAGKMATLGEMSAGVAHELNQPLAVIKAASRFLMKKVRKSEEIKEEILYTMVQEIDSHVDRATKIINHLRDFGRKAGVSREPVDVNEPLNRAHEMFAQQFRLKEIQVLKELDGSLPWVLADANRMEQVFINLLINARDAIVEKAESCGENGARKEILLKTFSLDSSVTIEITDSGNGIPERVLDKIFEPFFTTKRVGQGTGLGLSISYSIVQDYGGTIRVESAEGQGARFSIHLPSIEP